jgi:serine/threonine protein kinase
LEPKDISKKLGIKFESAKDDLDQLEVAVICSKFGQQFALVRHLHQPHAGTDILTDEHSTHLRQDLRDALQSLFLHQSDLTWTHPDIEMPHEGAAGTGWRIGNYEILDEIGHGGMGVIYRAREPHSGRIVALKCILAYQGDSGQALARFRRETEMAARLAHPNIVPIYHVGETADGSLFFTMKYAANGSLLQARGFLGQDPRQSILLIAKVARAVQYAHERGVLHRDLKPGNILLDGRGEPLVSDFGLARSEEIGSHLTRSLTSFGTPGYIAPEQADEPAAQLTPAADIYSLGAILFELLAGRLPFPGDNALGVLKQSAEKPAPKLRTLAPHLDRELETICARCLEREPASRYQSARSLAQDLVNWLETGGDPKHSHFRETFWNREGTFISRLWRKLWVQRSRR